VEKIKAMGIEIITSSPINNENFISQLQKGQWQAVFLATGLQRSKKIEVEGLNQEGVYWGLDFLRQAKERKQLELKGKVLVIGGGNVALDVAMTSLRLGAARVELACLEKREEMPAFAWEIKEAEEEGVAIHSGWGPHKIEREKNQIKGVELIGCTSVFDDKGVFSPAFDTSQRKFIEAETVILAVGQVADLSFLPPELGIKLSEGRIIEVDPETFATNIKGLFAGGEVAFGPSSAVEAMASGRKAASAIDKFLGGEGITDSSFRLPGKEKKDFLLGEEEGFLARERISMPTLPLAQRLHSFDLIQLGLNEEQARQEASRCLHCELRLQFSPVFLPPEKWLEFKEEAINQVPETEGVFQLLNGEREIIYIAGTPHLREALQEKLNSLPEAKYFHYEEEPMYTKRES
ncbi:MAG: FAD-dependent oxidoreductase, partial [Candidatus Aminicenantales bacterium]